MKAIQVRYLPPTDRKPSRLKVSAEGVKSVTVPKGSSALRHAQWDGRNGEGWRSHDHRSDEEVAVQALLDQNPQWEWELHDLAHGRLPNGDLVYVFKSDSFRAKSEHWKARMRKAVQS